MIGGAAAPMGEPPLVQTEDKFQNVYNPVDVLLWHFSPGVTKVYKVQESQPWHF